MFRISALMAFLALTATIATGVFEARAQTAAMERCVAACEAQGGKRCDSYCEHARATR
jgi:hypothetical protein